MVSGKEEVIPYLCSTEQKKFILFCIFASQGWSNKQLKGGPAPRHSSGHTAQVEAGPQQRRLRVLRAQGPQHRLPQRLRPVRLLVAADGRRPAPTAGGPRSCTPRVIPLPRQAHFHAHIVALLIRILSTIASTILIADSDKSQMTDHQKLYGKSGRGWTPPPFRNRHKRLCLIVFLKFLCKKTYKNAHVLSFLKSAKKTTT